MKTKFLVAILLLTTFSTYAQNIPSFIPTNGLLGWWPFNGNANDESGNGNNGTVNGAILASDRNGQNNKSYLFDGQNSYISLAAPFFNGSTNVNSFTFTGWFNLTTAPANNSDMTISSKEGFWRTTGIVIITQNNITSLQMSGSQPSPQGYWAINTSSNANIIQAGQWTFFAITFYSGLMQLFVNGSLISTYTNGYSSLDYSQVVAGNSTATNLFGGHCAASGFNAFFTGKIDDIGYWNRPLTQTEITNLYNGQSCTGLGAISADGPTTFCAGNYVYLTSDVVGGTYQWKKNGVNISTNATSRTYKATATGSYTCVANCNGSTLSSNAIVVTSKTNASAAVSASGATSFCAGDSVTLSATNLGSNYSVQWYRTNISMENTNNYSQVVKQPGTYKVVTKNLTTGCSRISSSSVVVAVNCRISNPELIAINDITNDDNVGKINSEEVVKAIKIFPNPNAGSFTFEYLDDHDGEGELQILNNIGQSIYSAIIPTTNGLTSHKIDFGNNFEPGIYFIRFNINGEHRDSKVILQ